jgi:hypothetical protein
VTNSDIFDSVDDCSESALLYSTKFVTVSAPGAAIRRLHKPRWYKVAGSGQWPDCI